MSFTMETRQQRMRLAILRFDYTLALVTIGVALFGVLMVFSATRESLRLAGLNQYSYLERQFIFVLIGVVVMIGVSLIDYRKISGLSVIAYAGVIIALLGVYIPHLGKSALGAQRWYQLGPFQIQPSEFAILGMILIVSYYVDQIHGEWTFWRLLLILGVVGIPMALIIKQPDIGTGLILGITTFVMLIMARVPGRFLLILLLGAAVGLYLVVHLHILKTFQLQRLSGFLTQNVNPLTVNKYNLTESKIAIGAGGLRGTGLFHGSQTNLSYVPEQQTDFIFTAVGEQLGFIGASLLLLAYVFITWRIWRALRWAKDDLGRVMVAGVVGLIVYSIFQNAGMTMGIMPITGIPLPFLSYGGSAILTFFAAIGLVINVGMRRAR